MKNLLIILTFVSVSSFSWSQDLHFSHYRTIPVNHNPAFVASHDDDYRINFIYRNQWSALGFPFVSGGVSYDKKINVIPQDLGIGLLLVTDKSGPTGLTQTKIMLTPAFHYKAGKSKIGIGVQAGVMLKGYSTDGITYPEQFDIEIGEFNSEFASGELNVNNELNYFDLNAGVLYQYASTWGNLKVGASAMHLTNPQESFLENQTNLAMRYIFETRAEVNLNSKLYLLPSLFIQEHNKANELLPAIGIGTHIAKNDMNAQKAYLNLAIRDGFTRNGDSFIVTAGLEFKTLQTFLSYDFNYSDLSAGTQGRGALELGLVIRGLTYKPESIILPCDRY